MFQSFKKFEKTFIFYGTINGTTFLFTKEYGTVFEPLWLSVFLIEPNVEVFAQIVSAFLKNKKKPSHRQHK